MLTAWTSTTESRNVLPGSKRIVPPPSVVITARFIAVPAALQCAGIGFLVAGQRVSFAWSS